MQIQITTTQIGTELINSVNSRELHRFLESKQDYSTWIKNRIEKYDFIENIDFETIHKKMDGGKFAPIDYIVSLDMAKELSMVENNSQGKVARRYFLEVEKNYYIGKEQFDTAVHALSQKSIEADDYKKKYYTLLEKTNVLLTENLANLTQKFNEKYKSKRRNFDVSEIETILKLKKEGFSYRDIGNKIGRSPNSIATKLRQFEESER